MRTSGISRALVSALLIIGLGALVMAGSGGGFARADPSLDWDVPNGHFFTQTSPEPGKGYIVGNFLGRRLWDEFQRLGGVPILGYPISNDFVWDGFRTQLFQRAVFQWRPEADQVYFINVFDELHDKGFDDWLLAFKSTPKPLDPSFDQGKGWDEIMGDRLALLDEEPAFKEKYEEARSHIDPLLLYGLPTSRVTDMGNHWALRLQRAAFQLWKVDVPWAKAGEVTVANGGAISVEAGLYKPEVTKPSDPYGQPPTPTAIVTPGPPATATATRVVPTPNPGQLPPRGTFVAYFEPNTAITMTTGSPDFASWGPFINLAFPHAYEGKTLTVRMERLDYEQGKPQQQIVLELWESFVGELRAGQTFHPPLQFGQGEGQRVTYGRPEIVWRIQYGQYFLYFPYYPNLGLIGYPPTYPPRSITYTIAISD